MRPRRFWWAVAVWYNDLHRLKTGLENMRGTAVMAWHYDGEVQIKKINMGPYNNNGYVVACPHTGEAVIIDTPAEPEKLVEAVRGLQVKAILITHGHQDHLLGFSEIKAQVAAPVAVGPGDAHRLPSPPERMLADGDIIAFGRLRITALATPGHTDGSTCFLLGNHLFSGDTLFPGGPGKSRSPEAFQQELKSITGKLLSLPPETAVYPGHGDDTTVGQARQEHQAFASRIHPPDLHGDVTWLGT
ncbi:MAG: MBL fold metallo-hydrolase [Dehalococcoidia bacterium]|nr:MBL fold metallo-hydrolase [Dehalococcoidia bacterium]